MSIQQYDSGSNSATNLGFAAYRGLNLVQPLSGARDIHLLGNGDEEAKIAEIHEDA